MNRTRILSALAALLLLGAWPASAQSSGWTEYRPASTLFTMGYQMAQPIGGLHDYIGAASFRGVTFDWQSMVAKSFSAGLRFNWNRFNETFSMLTQTTNTGGTLSAPVFRYADQFALEAVGRYYFGGEGMFTPYLGVGLGGVWSSSYQQTADLGASQSGFYFITSPEVGLMITLAKGSTSVGLNLGVMYNFTTINFRNVSNAQSLAETIALTFAY
jgi:opacity protein-like surface antigen